MAVRSKMSTARSRGRAVDKVTPGDGLPKSKPKEYSMTYEATPKSGYDFSIADVSPEDEKLIRKQYRLSDNEDFIIPKAEYDIWKKTGKKTPEQYGEERAKTGNNPFQEAYEGKVRTGLDLQLYEKGKAPKAKPDPIYLKEAASKVKPVPLKSITATTGGKNKNIIAKEKAAKEEVMVPEVVEGPKGRTVTRKKLVKAPNLRTAGTVTLRGAAAKSGQTNKSFSGSKQRTKEAKDALKFVNVKKDKGPRASEIRKYKKEEKLAGARERVLGLSGVALEDQVSMTGKPIKRGEKTPGSAQRLRDMKAMYDSSNMTSKGEKVNASTDEGSGGSAKRISLLKEAKSNIKDINKLSRSQVKAARANSGAKGRAITKAKAMKAEAKASAKPAKFSKDTSKEGLAKDIAAMKSVKSPSEIKAMKASAKSAMKEARGMSRTKEEKAKTRSEIKSTRGLAKEARSYKGDIRKGLRMEKMDTKAAKVAANASKEKKARKAEKGRTMKGTSYFSMTELNKKIPLSEAVGVERYRGKVLKESDIRNASRESKKPSTFLAKIGQASALNRGKSKTYSESQGTQQAGTRRFVRK